MATSSSVCSSSEDYYFGSSYHYIPFRNFCGYWSSKGFQNLRKYENFLDRKGFHHIYTDGVYFCFVFKPKDRSLFGFKYKYSFCAMLERQYSDLRSTVHRWILLRPESFSVPGLYIPKEQLLQQEIISNFEYTDRYLNQYSLRLEKVEMDFAVKTSIKSLSIRMSLENIGGHYMFSYYISPAKIEGELVLDGNSSMFNSDLEENTTVTLFISSN